MKKILFSSLIAMAVLTSSVAIQAKTMYSLSVNEWEDFYKYLGNNIKYPSKAVDENIQGNSLILFTVNKGKLKDLRIQNELGAGCDTEVLNKILSFPDFTPSKDGNYALTTSFKLHESSANIKNEDIKIPKGYTSLKINIIGFSPKTDVVTSFSYGKDTKKQANLITLGTQQLSKDLLIVFDGKILEYASLNSIDPNQIQSLDILKDDSSTALYGDKGKNGVIIITTKKTTVPTLNGDVKGISIQKSDHEIANLFIRGDKTWGKENPLVIIDGEVAELNSINPDHVESVSILKDASSTAIYGDKGKNGVVIITTKKAVSTLNGDVKGISVQKSDHEIANLFIRGDKTWGKENPLVIIDGEVAELNSTNPDHVESVSILKDSSSTAIYGDKGKNGVIIITTKKGTKSIEPSQKDENNSKDIIIRGKKARTGQEPLYVVDGEIIEDFSLISPNNIKEINISKSASGISIYGDKGKNGVIEITTKDSTKKEGISQHKK